MSYVSIGTMSLYPIEGTGGYLIPDYGISYRQWLIGMALSGGHNGAMAVEAADLVIKLLDREGDE